MAFYITTPIYYANGEPHIGHAYTNTLADVSARYHRLYGEETFFLTGIDEHGQKVEQAAALRNITPLQHCDEMVEKFKNLWARLDIQPDDFLRTTEPRHQKVVQQVLQQLWDSGQIYSDTYSGWYELSEERFLTDKEMEEKGYTKDSPEISQIEEKNYFFKMSTHQDWLLNHIEQHPEFIQPEGRRKEMLGFLKQPLGDLCISRPKSRLSWGIELPFDKDYVTYVWFDALLNYISAPLSHGGPEHLQTLWPQVTHLLGKDILMTHAIYWPTMLHAAGYAPPKKLIAHGWWMVNNAKMSKSKGNSIDPLDMIEKYGADAFRYVLMREMTLGLDSDFSEKSFVLRLNTDLANDFGNLLNRTLNLLNKYFEGVVPEPTVVGEAELAIEALALKTLKDTEALVRDFKMNQALDTVLQLVRHANKYINDEAPWATAKTDLPRAGTVLYYVLEVFRLAATLLSPVIPGKMASLLAQLGLNAQDLKLAWGTLAPGTQTQKPEVLFPRQEYIEKENTMENPTGNPTETAVNPVSTPAEKVNGAAEATSPEAAKDATKDAAQEAPQETFIGIEDFAKVELKVAEVVEAERVPKTDKLLRLIVKIGEEQRQIVAGIAAFYEPEALIGKQVVVVTNLKPVKLRGIESRGMILAAKSGELLSVLTPLNEVATGAQIS